MAINFAHAPPCGNAVSLTVMPVRRGAVWASAWRLLRRADDDFAGADDPTAVVVGIDPGVGTQVDVGSTVTITTKAAATGDNNGNGNPGGNGANNGNGPTGGTNGK